MRRRRSRTRRTVAKTGTPQLNKAIAIVTAMTSRGAQRSTIVQNAIKRAGISVRTYRTARAQMGTVAVRRSKRYRRRGGGQWWVKRR
jgi:hypothetical protein